MSVYLAPSFGVGYQGFTVGGLPLNGGFIYTYIAGGTTPQATYTTYLGNVQNANPIQLGVDGRPPQEIWLSSGTSYRFDLKDSAGSLIKTYDNISASSFVFAADLASQVNPPGSDLVGVLRSDNLGATLTQILESYAFLRGNQTPVAASAMKLDLTREVNSTDPLVNLGAMWVADTYSYAGISKEFTASDGAANAPCTALVAYAVNNNSPADVVGILAVAKAETTSDAVYAANFIATSQTGIATPKLIGLEIDIAPAAGVTAANTSGAVFINAFNSAIPGPLIQTGGISGGTFADGIVFAGGIASTGSCVAIVSGTVDSFINTTGGTFNTSAIILGNTHRINLRGTASAHAFIYNDSGNALRIVGGSASTVIRNNADTVSNWSFGATGVASLCSTATINWDTNQVSGSASAGAIAPTNFVGYIQVQIAGVVKKIPYYDN